MKIPKLSRLLIAVTLVASVALAAGGYVLGGQLASKGPSASVPVAPAVNGSTGDPIVSPLPLDIPGD